MDQLIGENWINKSIDLKNMTRFLYAIIYLLFLIAVSALAAENVEAPDEILIENRVYDVDRKAPVWFSHLAHAEDYVDTCDQCHHEYKDGKNIWEENLPVKKCVVCHHPSKNKGNVKKLNTAYHNNCKGCHRKLAKEGGTDAPFMQCTDCHEKR